MYFTSEWVSDWLDKPVNNKDLSEHLTMAGLEVDSTSVITDKWIDVVTARIIKINPHPQADRLNICTVDAGDEEHSDIVCGAPNVYEGMNVALAKVGAVLRGTKIKVAKIRNVESKGMLCSASELGLGEDSGGLLDLGDVEVGHPLTDYIATDDTVYKLDLTPNRGDCWSILGIAREIAIIYKCSLAIPQIKELKFEGNQKQKIRLTESQACPIYLSSIITELDCRQVAPLWLRERIRRGGVRSVHPLVDILNYVMLEWGQPMHAFDREKIDGELVVRHAKAGESMTAIGGQHLELKESDLVICDSQRVQALAGVIGAEHSAVSEKTTEVVLECAFFIPQAIATSARSHNLQTEASQRFERGVDFTIQNKSLNYALTLINDYIGGHINQIIDARDNAELPDRLAITLRSDVLNRYLGISVDEKFIEHCLSSLGCQLERENVNSWKCIPPSWRFDLAIEEDLIEEIGRMYGYDNIEEKIDISLSSFPSKDDNFQVVSRMQQILINSGYYEVVAYSLSDRKSQELFSDGELVQVKNPISQDMEVMCITLWPSLLQVLTHNLRRQYNRARLFQIDKVFSYHKKKVIENLSLAGIVCGSITPEQWKGHNSQADFYSVKGDVERLLLPYDNIIFKRSENIALHPWRSADIVKDGSTIGRVGQLSPQLSDVFKIEVPVILFELNLSDLPELNTDLYQAISPYPSVRRDLAVMIKTDILTGDLEQCIRSVSSELLRDIVIFDIFTGRTVEDGYKSVALGLIFQSSSCTLKKKEIDILVEKIVEKITKFGGLLRSDTRL